MPATILPFERRDSSNSAAVRSDAPDPDSPRLRAPHPFAVPAARLTSRSIAHRWAMLSHLTRHAISTRRFAARPRDVPDPIR
jgi:hypothetical protein